MSDPVTEPATLEDLLAQVNTVSQAIDKLNAQNTTPPAPVKPVVPNVVATEVQGQKDVTTQKIQSVIEQFSQIQEKLQMSETERATLKQQLEELQMSTMTDKQKLELQLASAQKELKTKMDSLTADANAWRSRYEDQQIQASVQKAVADNKGLNADQFLALFKMYGTSVKEADGNFDVKVTFPDVDSKGNQIKTELSPTEAVKRMFEIPGYQNMFDNPQKPGTGMTNQSVGGSPTLDVANMDLDDYAKNRDAIMRQQQ